MVMPLDLIGKEKEHDYDKERYRDMLLEAAETILGYFGFERTLYGVASPNKNRKCWYGLSEERRKDL
jgi:hypothetical protein